MKPESLIAEIIKGDQRSLARAITTIENRQPGSEDILQALPNKNMSHLVGITGPPGAGKSSLINALLNKLAGSKKVAVLAVDPTSPFTHGSLLGDRLRMSEHFNNKNVFIRSLATRGALGGLSASAFEIADILAATGFDYVFIETVGVGQSEVEIASLADTTVVVLNPESGDDVQMLKSGIVEIADIFVVNKSDRNGADIMVKYIQSSLHERPLSNWNVPVVKTTAINQSGIEELIEKIDEHRHQVNHEKKASLLAVRAYKLIQNYRMSDVNVTDLETKLVAAMDKSDFNFYKFVRKLV